MKNALILLLFVLASISCEHRKPIELEFENQLPKNDLVLLEKLVVAYDDFIATVYGGEADTFFSHMVLNKPIVNESNQQKYCELLRLFEESTLEYKNINVKYDSVYLSDDGDIKRIYQEEDRSEYDFEEEIEVLPPPSTIKKEIEKIKESGYWRFISESSFTSALSTISNGNLDVEEYVDSKYGFGYINPRIMAASLAEDKLDKDDYFIKRIITIELFIQYLRKEYTC